MMPGAAQPRPAVRRAGDEMLMPEKAIKPGKGGFHAVPAEAASASNGPQVECKTCGRSFNEKSLAKHSKACEKVFVQKREIYSSIGARVKNTETAKHVNPSTFYAENAAPPIAERRAQSSWRAQRGDLRTQMIASRMASRAEAQE